MIRYEAEIVRRIAKKIIPEDVFIHFNNVFMALNLTKDLRLFDIKQLKMSKNTGRVYYRLHKGKYRAIFYMPEDGIYVVALDKREEVYKKWR
jgi:mRNA interferase RelE/StbE